VTQRVGALEDRYLARDRPLGEARLLWEIGAEGSDLRQLRARLGLDAGYLSRLLRSLERDGLVVVESSERDRRVRTARLTAAGMAERDLLERGSDELARSFLEPLSESRRERLVAAMADVERLLTGALVDLEIVDPADRVAQFCLREYFSELDRRFESGFDPPASMPTELDQLRPPVGFFLVATLRTEPVGCAGLKLNCAEPAEITRMWVAESARGSGIARRLLDALERRAAAAGSSTVRLDTNKALTQAIALYRSAGYHEIAAFNDNPYAHHWFEKQLQP
jgi:DNA-binding MarR family transcriptional regulator/GNAT superfamily N-acetyltransferase